MGDATLELRLRVRGGDDFAISSPVDRLLVGSFVPGGRPTDVPTLASIERVNGLLAQLELTIADRAALRPVGQLLTHQYLLVPPERWQSAVLSLDVVAGVTAPERAVLHGIDAVRSPLLGGVEGLRRCETPLERHRAESQLTDRLLAEVRARPTWVRYAELTTRFLGRTVLEALTVQLVGIPLASLLGAGTSDAFRRIGA